MAGLLSDQGLKDYLRKAAFHYLERYASSEAHLRKLLQRKLNRRLEQIFAEESDHSFRKETVRGDELINDAVCLCHDLDLLNDARFAEVKIANGRRKGHSRARIAAALFAKGVEPELAITALAADETSEEEAAIRLAKRRRLGPWRKNPVTDLRRTEQREIAALCRNGFSPGLAARIVRMTDEEAQKL